MNAEVFVLLERSVRGGGGRSSPWVTFRRRMNTTSSKPCVNLPFASWNVVISVPGLLSVSCEAPSSALRSDIVAAGRSRFHRGHPLSRRRNGRPSEGRPLSLDDELIGKEGDAKSRVESLTEDSDRRLNRDRRSRQDQFALGSDLRAVGRRLPVSSRDLAIALTQKSAAQIAREWRQPEKTIRRKVQKIRKVYEDAGLKEYLALIRVPTYPPQLLVGGMQSCFIDDGHAEAKGASSVTPSFST